MTGTSGELRRFAGRCRDCGRDLVTTLPTARVGTGDHRIRLRCQCGTTNRIKSSISDGDTPNVDCMAYAADFMVRPDDVLCWFPDGSEQRGQWGGEL